MLGAITPMEVKPGNMQRVRVRLRANYVERTGGPNTVEEYEERFARAV